jgi:hypothetical protein
MSGGLEGEALSRARTEPSCCPNVWTTSSGRTIRFGLSMPSVLGFAGVVPEATGRPSYHPATPLKIYLYGYLNQVQPSRRLERETRRNLEVMWLTGRLTPDFQPASPGELRNDEDEGDHASLTRR